MPPASSRATTRLAPSASLENVLRAPPRNETRGFLDRPSARRRRRASRSQPRTQTLDDAAETRPPSQHQFEILGIDRGVASDTSILSRTEASNATADYSITR